MDKQVSSDPGHDPQPNLQHEGLSGREMWHESMSEADVANKVWKLWTHLMQGKEKEKKTVRAYATHLPCLWLVSCEFYGRRHWPTTTEVRAMWIASLSPQNSPTLFLLRPFFSSTHSSPLFLFFLLQQHIISLYLYPFRQWSRRTRNNNVQTMGKLRTGSTILNLPAQYKDEQLFRRDHPCSYVLLLEF